jgi:hypothetical protein
VKSGGRLFLYRLERREPIRLEAPPPQEFRIERQTSYAPHHIVNERSFYVRQSSKHRQKLR